MSRKRGVASQKHLKVDKSLFDTHQMWRAGETLLGGRTATEEDESHPRFVQKSAEVMNSRMAESHLTNPYVLGRRRWDKITRWAFAATHAKLFVKTDAVALRYKRVGDT